MILLALAACQRGGASAEVPSPTAGPSPAAREPAPTSPAQEAAPPTANPAETPASVYGPEDFPPGINPLTGLPVDDPAVLNRRPIVVKVSNESDEVRPQSGLSFADHVWMYQTEGWRQTRLAAIIYSQAPERVGSVRSARLIDSDHLVPMYDALLAISGASVDMYRVLMNSSWWDRVFREDPEHYYQVRLPDVPRPGTDYYHTLFAVPEHIWEGASERGLNQPPHLEGLRFDPAAPPGGSPTSEMVIDYPEWGPQQTWRYDRAGGRWLSWTEMQLEQEGREQTPDIDLLTGEQLAFDNVVIIWAEHYWAPDFAQVPGLGVEMVGEGEAVLLRDGQRYEVTWRRDDPEELIQFFDRSGGVIPFKPGRTWFHVASTETTGYPPAVRFAP